MIAIRKVKKINFNDFVKLHGEFIKIYRKVSDYKIKNLSKDKLKEEFNSRFGKDKFFYLAVYGTKPIGYIYGCLEKSNYGDFGYIDDVFVLKKYQNMGVSTKLKDKLLNDFRKKGIKYCRLDVNPQNKLAIERYKEWGFKVDKFRMAKEI